MKGPHYQIVQADSLPALEAEVGELLNIGWQLQGGVAVMRYERMVELKGYTEEEWVWAQAMTKPRDED